jgi:hypothetical protein
MTSSIAIGIAIATTAALHVVRINLLPDEDANYTYNYGPDPYTLDHICKDVAPQYLIGGHYTPNPTTVTQCR